MSMHDIIRDCKTSRGMRRLTLMFVLSILGKEMLVYVWLECDPDLSIFPDMSQLALKSNTERICCEQVT